jgi:hypothetical protein
VVSLLINGNIVFKDVGRHNSAEDKTYFVNPIQIGGNLSQPFTGKVTDFNVWNVSLSDIQLTEFSACTITKIYTENVTMPLQWSMTNISLPNNSSKKTNVSLEDICSELISAKLMLFQMQVTAEQAFIITDQLNGEMYLPRNNAELGKALLNGGKQLNASCFNSFWVPIVRSTTSYTEWVNRANESETITYHPWYTGQPNGYPTQNCLLASKVGYSDADCNDKKCFFILFQKSPVFHMRGQYVLDPNTDNQYVFKFEAIANGIFKFQGFSGLSDISRNFSSNYWSIDSYNSTTGATTKIGYLKEINKFPFGTFNWYFTTEKTYLPMKISKVIVLLQKVV